MQLKSFEIFKKPLTQLLSQNDGAIDSELKAIELTELTTSEVQDLQFRLFNKYYRFPKFVLGEESKDFKTDEVPNNIASSLIGNGFSFGISKPTSTITQVDYIIKYEGGFESVNISAGEYSKTVKGHLTHDTIHIQLFFQGSDVDSFAPHAKEQKTIVLESLKANNANVLAYIENNKNSILSKIKEKIDTRLGANKKRAEDLSKF